MNPVTLLFCASSVAFAPSAGWVFHAERVTLDVGEHAFTVTGEYEFSVHPTGSALAFRYPFPIDDSLGAPELVEATMEDSAGRRALSVIEGDGCWRWLAEPGLGERCTIRVIYRQSMRDDHAAYVLTSTQSWRRPIDRAHLEVRVPAARRCTIRPELPLAYTDGGWSVYRGEFLAFNPTEDLRVDLIDSRR